MKRILLALLVLAACASAPAPKAPDESRRVPVNRVMPPEATPDEGKKTSLRRQSPGTREVEWR